MLNMWNLVLICSVVFIVFVAVALGIYYLISKKNMAAQHEHFKKLHETLHPTQKVMLSNGIYGTVKQVGTDTVEVEIAKGIVIKVSRYAISEIITK